MRISQSDLTFFLEGNKILQFKLENANENANYRKYFSHAVFKNQKQ